MAHLDDAVLEVERLDLAERPAGADDLRRELRDRGAQLVLAGRGDAARGQQRRAEDHARAEALVLLAVESAVVVGERVEVEVLDESVEPDRDAGAPGEVLVVDGVVEREDLAGEGHPLARSRRR